MFTDDPELIPAEAPIRHQRKNTYPIDVAGVSRGFIEPFQMKNGYLNYSEIEPG